jgi:hypothetical protein
MLDECCVIDGEKVWQPCADDERGHPIDAGLIARFLHAKQSLLNASNAMREAYDRADAMRRKG